MKPQLKMTLLMKSLVEFSKLVDIQSKTWYTDSRQQQSCDRNAHMSSVLCRCRLDDSPSRKRKQFSVHFSLWKICKWFHFSVFFFTISCAIFPFFSLCFWCGKNVVASFIFHFKIKLHRPNACTKHRQRKKERKTSIMRCVRAYNNKQCTILFDEISSLSLIFCSPYSLLFFLWFCVCKFSHKCAIKGNEMKGMKSEKINDHHFHRQSVDCLLLRFDDTICHQNENTEKRTAWEKERKK